VTLIDRWRAQRVPDEFLTCRTAISGYSAARIYDVLFVRSEFRIAIDDAFGDPGELVISLGLLFEGVFKK